MCVCVCVGGKCIDKNCCTDVSKRRVEAVDDRPGADKAERKDGAAEQGVICIAEKINTKLSEYDTKWKKMETVKDQKQNPEVHLER